MAGAELFTVNLATTAVTSGGTTAPAGGTSETWTVASSAMFGAAAAGVSQFHVADTSAAASSEMIAVTNVSGTTWTVTRGAEGTTPAAHSPGFTVCQVVTAAWLATVQGAAVPVPGPTGVTATDTANVAAAVTTLGNALSRGPATLLFPDGTYVIDAGTAVITGLSNFTVRGTGATVIQLAPNRPGQYNSNGDLAVIADCSDFSVSGIRFDWNRDIVAPVTPLTASAASGQPSVTVAAGQGARYLAGHRLNLFGGIGSIQASTGEPNALTISSVTAGGGAGGGDLITFTGNLANSYTVISGTLVSDGFGPYGAAGAFLTPYQAGAGFSAAGRLLGNEDTQNALHLMGCQRFLITGCEARSTWESQIKLGNGFTATKVADGCSQGIISDCRVQHGYDQGISVWASDHITITGNKAQASGWAGISLSGSADCTVTGNVATANIYTPAFDTGEGTGIAVEGGLRCVVADNVCSQNNSNGIRMSGSPVFGTSVAQPVSGSLSAGATSVTITSTNSSIINGSSYTIVDSVNPLIRETLYVTAVSGTALTVQPLRNNYSSGPVIRSRYGQDCLITGNTCAQQPNGAGIHCEDQIGLKVFANDCSENGLSNGVNTGTFGTWGIYAGANCHEAVLDSNTCNWNAGEGISAVNCTGLVIRGNSASQSGVRGGGGSSGIKLDGIADAVIADNECNFNTGSGIQAEDSSPQNQRLTISGNTCLYNSQSGIVLVGTLGCSVNGNTAGHNGSNGLWAEGIANSEFSYNQCFNQGGAGIQFHDGSGSRYCTGNIVTGNLLFDDQGSPAQPWGFIDSANSAGNLITRNRAYGNTNAGQISAQASDTVSGNSLAGGGWSSYDPAVAADSPSMWWKLADATGTATEPDSSGNSHTGTIANLTLQAPGPLPGNPAETAGLFNGTSSAVTSSYLLGSQSAVSFEIWLNTGGIVPGGQPRLFCNSHTDNDFSGFQFRLTVSAGLVYMNIAIGNGIADTEITSSVPLPPGGGWVHVVATYDSTTILLYQNGFQVASGARSGPMSAGSASGVAVGFNPVYSGDYYAGLLAQAIVYAGTTLTAARVRAHYMAGAS